MPEQMLGKWYRQIKKEWKLIAAAVFGSGLLAYAYRFFNMLPNWDTLMDYYYPTNNMIHQGRHLQIIGCLFSSFYDIPWITGLLCLLYIAVSVILITEILQIHDTIGILCLSVLMTLFPTVISSFAFMYMADAFHSAMLFAVLAVWLTLRCRRGWLAGGICLCMSVGIYQAYLPFAIGLILIWLVDKLLFTEEKPVKQILHFALMGIWGMVFYIVSLGILSALEGVAVSNHQGMGSMGIPDLLQVITAFFQSYVDTLYFFFGSLKQISLYQIGNLLLFFCAALAVVLWVIKQKAYQRWGRILLACLCVAVIPCVAHIFYFLTEEVWYHALMQGTLWLCYALAFLLLERTGFMKKKLAVWGMIGTVFAAYACILAANTAYLKMNTSYEKTMAMLNRIVDRMEQMPDYEEAERIAVIGEVKDAHTAVAELNPSIVGVTEDSFVTHQKHMVAALSMYYRIDLTGVQDEELSALYAQEVVKEMPEWPEEGSICQLGDMIVIKFSEPQSDEEEQIAGENHE